MRTSCRSWWRNCALKPDSEILDIDRMEDHITPIGPNVSKIRELISSLELCHHKVERWVYNIIEAIGAGETTKGLGTQNAYAALSAWGAGCPSTSVELTIDSIPASRMLTCLEKRSPLKEWQVQRVIDKIRSSIHWPQSCDDPTAQYVWLLLSGGEYESAYRSQCLEHYREHEDFWLTTVRTIIHDTIDGHQSELSLALAIDMLWPCHWKFTENLQIVLEAIGGRLHPEKPFAACGRNIALLPNHERMEILSKTLRVFCCDVQRDTEVDIQMLAMLGEPTEVKRWLAASLDKTIRLQLNPPAKLRVLSALEGPAWIKQ